jgi:hypothetical protein
MLGYIVERVRYSAGYRTKRWDRLDTQELRSLGSGAGIPVDIVVRTATEAVEAFREARERAHLPIANGVAAVVEQQLQRVPLALRA